MISIPPGYSVVTNGYMKQNDLYWDDEDRCWIKYDYNDTTVRFQVNSFKKVVRKLVEAPVVSDKHPHWKFINTEAFHKFQKDFEIPVNQHDCIIVNDHVHITRRSDGFTLVQLKCANFPQYFVFDSGIDKFAAILATIEMIDNPNNLTPYSQIKNTLLQQIQTLMGHYINQEVKKSS